jgi:dihydroflavonol-4-reductase
MKYKGLTLVTGANGHLGNNLVRFLLHKGIPVRASVRNPEESKEAFEGLTCEVVKADITNKASMVKALQGVEVFYAVGAVFKLWAKNPQKEIYEANLEGVKLTMEAAAEAGVKRVVYVSSIAALNYTKSPINEESGYNPDRRDAYYNSKNDGEKLAIKLANELGLDLVIIMPGAMIGREAFGKLNTSYNILRLILKKEVPIETNIVINWIDVNDVAWACWQGAEEGKNGQRYIIANPKALSIRETTEIASRLFPEKKIKLPVSVPRFMLYAFAWILEVVGKITSSAPLMSTKEVGMFSGLKQDFDISKARKELGFNPKAPELAVEEALIYLEKNMSRLK